MVTAIGVLVGLTIGNFMWVMMRKEEWNKAVERSFYQALALGIYLLLS